MPEHKLKFDSVTENLVDGGNCVAVASDEPFAPKDRYHCMFLIVLFLGVATLFPWNAFLSKIPYFEKVLTKSDTPNKSTDLGEKMASWFSPALSLCNMLPLVFTHVVNTLYFYKLKVSPRIYLSLLLIFIGFAINLGLTAIKEEIVPFFVVVLILVVIISAASAILQSALFSLLFIFPPRYVGAFVVGQAISGIATNLMAILDTAVFGEDFRSGAVMFFIVALISIIICTILFAALPSLPIYRHYMNIRNKEEKTQNKSSCSEPVYEMGFMENLADYWRILKILKYPAMSVYLVFTVTLMIFPTVFVNTPSAYGQSNTWGKSYFFAVAALLCFNLGDFFGRQLASFYMFPCSNTKWAVFIVISRIILLPLLLLGANPNVIFKTTVYTNDGAVGFLSLILGLTNGYFSTVALSVAPGLLDRASQPKGGVTMISFLSCGLATGSFLSFAIKTMFITKK